MDDQQVPQGQNAVPEEKKLLTDAEKMELYGLLSSCMEFFGGSHERVERDALKLCEHMKLNPMEVLFQPDGRLVSMLQLADTQSAIGLGSSDDDQIRRSIHGFIVGIGIRAFVKSLATLCAGEVYAQIAAGTQNSNVRYLENLKNAIPQVQQIFQKVKQEYRDEFIKIASGSWLNLESVEADCNSEDPAIREAGFRRAAMQIGSMTALCPVGLVPAE